MKDIPQIPSFLDSGNEKINQTIYHFQAFKQVGPSMKLCFTFMKKQFSLQTISLLAVQMVKIYLTINCQLNVFEKMHGKFIVHRNIKLKHILTSNFKSSDLSLIGFRNAQKYKKNGLVIQTENKKLQNKNFACKFSSIGTHMRLSSSPKDDLESLGYILIYLSQQGLVNQYKLLGNLFDQEGKKREEKLRVYEEIKLRLIPEQYFKNIPNEFCIYLNYVRNSNIGDYPFGDYEFLKKLFKGLLKKLNFDEAGGLYEYEWVTMLIKYCYS